MKHVTYAPSIAMVWKCTESRKAESVLCTTVTAPV